MKILVNIALAAVALCMAAGAQAQAWPQKPVRLVVPFAAGGPADTLARFLGARIGTELGQPVVIDNKAGAGGTLGAAEVARSPADGSSFLFSSTGALVIFPVLSANMPYNPEKDLIAVGHAVTTPMVIVTGSKSAHTSIAELVKNAKASPGKINYASAGNGTTTHLGAELLKREAGIELVHVPYRGAAPAITDLIAGVADLLVADVPAALSYIKGGQLRPLAVTWPTRSTVLPDVPTTAELGMKAVVSSTWYGVMASAKTPPEIVTRMNAALNKVLAQPETQAFLQSQGVEAAGGSAADFTRFVQAESVKWGTLARETGAKLD